jgi:hypothetical protein
MTKYITSEEYLALTKSKDKLGNAINFYNTEIGRKIASECQPVNINPNSKADYPPDSKRLFVTQFKVEIQKDRQLSGLVDVDKFCECLATKIMKIFTYPEIYKLNIQQALGSNSKFLQARDECLKESYK